MFVDGLKKYIDTDRIAVDVSGGAHLSYKELYNRSKSLAHYIEDNYKSNKPVAIFGDRQADMVTCAYAAVMAKKTFIMLSDTYPVERLKYIIKDCDADLLISVSEKEFNEVNLPRIFTKDIDQCAVDYASAPDLDTDNYNMDDNAFIIYTSGSTGNPKGVQITYENLNYYCTEGNVLNKYAKYINEDLRCVTMSSYSFIINMLFFRVIEIGGTWYVIKTELLRNNTLLFENLKRIQPHMFSLTPSIASKLLEYPEFNKQQFTKLVNVGLGGEPLNVDLARRLNERFPRMLNNAFGATETTSTNIAHSINQDDLNNNDNNYIAVGDVERAKLFMIVDDNNNIINEDNVVGNATFFGKGITKGYINLPELTKQHYVMIDGKRCFITGDLAYYNNGLIYLVGRSDNQIKIGGNRVELEDVEAHLNKCNEVKECVVGVSVDENKTNSLTAIIVLKEEYKQEKRSQLFLSIKKQMIRMVEGFKIPQKLLFTENLPRNYSGKIDRPTVQRICNGEKDDER